MRWVWLKLLLTVGLLIAGLQPLSAQATTCAERVTSEGYPRHRSQAQIQIPAQGLDPLLIQGLQAAAQSWNQRCGQADLPTLHVDINTPPPNDNNYNSATTLQVHVQSGCGQDNRRVCEPEWVQERGTWHVGQYDSQTGSTIVLPTLCPDPRPNNQGVMVHASSCDTQGSRILWNTEIAQRWLTHELGHALGLGHDACDANSVMQAAPQPTSIVRDEHCSLAEALHCNPELLPPGETCPEIPPSSDEVAFKVRVSGLSPNGRVTITRSLFTATTSLGFQELATGNGTLQFFPAPAGSNYAVYQKQELGSPFSCEPSDGYSDTVTDQPVDLAFRCRCEGGGESCRQSQDSSTFGPFFPPQTESLCILLPRFCDPDGFGPWWWAGFGPPTGPQPCQSRTECADVTVCEDRDADGQPDHCTTTTTCRDLCTGATTATSLVGPATTVAGAVVCQGTACDLEIEGFAYDDQGLAAKGFFVDHQPVALEGFEDGLFQPEGCDAPLAGGQSTCDPYGGFRGRLPLGSLASGEHALQVVVEDGHPGYPVATVAEIPFTVAGCGDGVRPTTSIVSPVAGDTVGGTVQIEAAAQDDQEVVRVDFFVDGVRKKSDFAAPYTYDWNTAGLGGLHTLGSQAVDRCGNRRFGAQIQITVDNSPGADWTPPAATVESPAHDATVTGRWVPLFGWAMDASGVAALRFTIDGELLALRFPVQYGLPRVPVCAGSEIADPSCPHVGWNTQFDSTLLVDGPHILGVTAEDSAGNELTVHQPILVLNAQAPEVTLLWPGQGEVLAGVVEIQATAEHPSGIQRLEIYLGNRRLGVLTAPPYELAWDTRAVSDGVYTLWVKAYTTAGVPGMSAFPRVTVENVP